MLNIKIDSRKIQPGDTFVAIRGIKSDGHEYINTAIKNGATKIIAEEGSYEVETLIVENTKDYLATYLRDTYSEDLKNIKFIGVTGTNGKTTMCYFAYKLLNLLGKKTAYIGTIGFYINDEVRELKNTTPEITDLYDMFLTCKENNIEVIVMEVSSHALELKRINEMKFDIVSFTNFAQDHIDLHLTMDNYLKAKQKLFKMIKTNGYAVINGDDDYAKDFIFEHNNNLVYGVKENADYKILDYNLEINNTSFRFLYEGKEYNANINMPGMYNIYNFLGALIIVNKLGFDINNILEYAKLIIAPPGRMESISYNNAVIIIDYAHNPDGVLNVMKTVTAFKKGKIITVIGCAGERDRSKRPIMGDIVTKYSDKVIFTNDDPHMEDPKVIMNDMVDDLTINNFEIEYDRKVAIKKAIDMIEPNDMLLLLGKGHEMYQIIGNDYIPHNDKICALEYIESKNN